MTNYPHSPSPPPAAAASNESESLFSIEPIMRWLRYVQSAVRRNRFLAVIVFVAMFALSGMLLAGDPPTYQTSATILLGGDRSLGGTEGVTDSASRQARALILRQESLDNMIDELGLLENGQELPFFGELRESVFTSVFGEAPAEERLLDLRDELRLAISVVPLNEDASIGVDVLWSDPEQAVAIADMAYLAFLEGRTRIEVDPLREALSIVQARAVEADQTVERLRDDLDLSASDGAPAGSELETAVRAQQDLDALVRQAEVDLDQAEAGAPFRYELLAPPELPRAPVTSNLTNYIAILMFSAIMTGLVCFAIDRPRGRVVEPWQLEPFNLPILAKLSERSA